MRKSKPYARGLALSYISLPFLVFFLFSFASCSKKDFRVAASEDFPVIKSVSPHNDQSQVSIDEDLVIEFNHAISCDADFQVSLKAGGTLVNGTILRQKTSLIFSPSNDLIPDVSYEADILISQKNTEGLLVSSSYHWKFTTKSIDEYEMTRHSEAVTDFERDGSRVMQIGDYLYSFGGWSMPDQSFNDVYRSSGDLSSWEKRNDAPWHGRHVFGIASLNGATFVMGGDNLQDEFDVWKTTDGDNWTQLADNILDNRIYYGSCAHNGYLYVVGGLGHNDVWRSKDGSNWQQVNAYVPFLNGENFSGSLVSFNGKLWMICGGGSGGGTGDARKTIWTSTDGVEWKAEQDFPGSARYYTDLCVWDQKLWVIGGYSDQESNIRSIWYMDRKSVWTEFIPPVNYQGRHATGVGVYNNELAITCGNFFNDCWVIKKSR